MAEMVHGKKSEADRHDEVALHILLPTRRSHQKRRLIYGQLQSLLFDFGHA